MHLHVHMIVIQHTCLGPMSSPEALPSPSSCIVHSRQRQHQQLCLCHFWHATLCSWGLTLPPGGHSDPCIWPGMGRQLRPYQCQVCKAKPGFGVEFVMEAWSQTRCEKRRTPSCNMTSEGKKFTSVYWCQSQSLMYCTSQLDIRTTYCRSQQAACWGFQRVQ